MSFYKILLSKSSFRNSLNSLMCVKHQHSSIRLENYRTKYSISVTDHFMNPRNIGQLDKNDPDVGTGLVGSPACGDVMKLQIKVNQKTGEIVEVKHKVFGCGSAIASSSLVTHKILNKNINTIKITNQELANELNLPPVKLHCSMLAENALESAKIDYFSKQKQK